MRHTRTIIVLFSILALIYILEGIFIPAESRTVARYDLSPAIIKLLTLTVTLPLIAVWAIGLYSFLKLAEYTHAIRATKEGKAFQTITWGMLLLAFWLPISSVIGNGLSYIYHQNPATTATMVIVNNYISVTLLLTTFIIIWIGARKLLKTVRPQASRLLRGTTALVFFASSALYVYLTLNNPGRRVPIQGSASTGSYLPDALLFATIVIPYVFVWYLGIRSIQYLYIYRQQSAGMIYRRAIAFLASGIGFVIGSVMVIRYVNSMTSWFDSLNLKLALITVYCLIFCIGVGFVCIAIGAKRLKHIEEV